MEVDDASDNDDDDDSGDDDDDDGNIYGQINTEQSKANVKERLLSVIQVQ